MMVRRHGESIQSRLTARLEAAPDGRAIAFIDDRGRYAWRTFGEFADNAAGYGARLTELGVRPGEVCLLVVSNDEFGATALLSALWIGAVPVLVAPPVVRGLHSNLKQVLRHVVRKTGAKFVIGNAEVEVVRQELLTGRRSVRFVGPSDLAGVEGYRADPSHRAGSDIAALQLTSGTTGFPRVCVWKQAPVLAELDGMTRAMRVTGDDLFVNWTPLYHDMGLMNNFMLCMVKGVPLALMGATEFAKNPSLWIRALTDIGATVTWSPNFGYALATQRISDDELEGVDLSGVHAFWNAAERIHAETIEAFYHRFAPFGVRREALKTNFGLAENVGGATFSDPDGCFLVEHVDSERLFDHGVAVPVPKADGGHRTVSVVGVGRPYPGMTIAITSRSGRVLPDGQVGEIRLRTPSRMEGYLKDVASTGRAIDGEWLRTGDMGYKRDDELFWVGRVRERITLHGRKFDPSDFERVLLSVDGLRPGSFAVFGADDPKAGTQRLVVLAEVRSANGRPHKAIMTQICQDVAVRLGLSVSEVVLLPQATMTKTSSGKRRHRYYRELYEKGELEPVARLRLG